MFVDVLPVKAELIENYLPTHDYGQKLQNGSIKAAKKAAHYSYAAYAAGVGKGIACVLLLVLLLLLLSLQLRLVAGLLPLRPGLLYSVVFCSCGLGNSTLNHFAFFAINAIAGLGVFV